MIRRYFRQWLVGDQGWNPVLKFILGIWICQFTFSSSIGWFCFRYFALICYMYFTKWTRFFLKVIYQDEIQCMFLVWLLLKLQQNAWPTNSTFSQIPPYTRDAPTVGTSAMILENWMTELDSLLWLEKTRLFSSRKKCWVCTTIQCVVSSHLPTSLMWSRYGRDIHDETSVIVKPMHRLINRMMVMAIYWWLPVPMMTLRRR